MRILIAGFALLDLVLLRGSLPITASLSGQEASQTAFADATATHVPAAPELHALDAALGDFDRDGNLDVAVAVEYGVNRIYRNDGKGRLSWVEGALGATPHDSEHVEAVDVDRDGLLDLIFVAEDDRRHQLFLGRPSYLHVRKPRVPDLLQTGRYVCPQVDTYQFDNRNVSMTAVSAAGCCFRWG